jgi:hypothetical protein
MIRMYDRAFQAMELLCEKWHLRRIIFDVPEQFERAPESEIGAILLAAIETRQQESETPGLTALCLEGMRLANATVERKGLKGEDASMLLLSAFLRPYFGYRTELLKDGKPIKGPKKHSTLVWYIVRESLRLTQHDATLASDLLTYAHQLIKASYLYFYVTHAAIEPQVSAAAEGTASAAVGVVDAATAPVLSLEQQVQLVTGNILRLAGASTSIALDVADVILEQQLRQQVREQSARPSIPLSASCAFDSALGVPLEWAAAHSEALSFYALRDYRYWIEKRSNLLQLQVWKMTPLVAGTDPQLCALLGIPTKGGPHIGQIVNRMIEWQILNADKLLAAKNAMVTANAAANAAAAATPPAPEAAAAAAAAAASAPAASAPAAVPAVHHHHSHTPHSSHVLVVDDALKAECFAWVARYKHTFEVAERKGAPKK